MNPILKSYIPETLFLASKQDASMEQYAEDLAVLDAANGYRVLACRATALTEGEALPEAWGIAPSELDFLERAILHHRRVAVLSDRGVVLFLSDLIEYTGILIALRPYLGCSTFLGALRFLHYSSIECSPAALAQVSAQEKPTEGECEQVARLLYYTERIIGIDRRYRIGLWPRCLLISRFAGCSLDRTLLSAKAPALSCGDEARLIAFFLCAMLKLREMNGRVSAEETEHPRFSCRIAIEPVTEETVDRSAIARERFPFLSLPEFKRFSLTEEDGGMTLEAFLHDAPPNGALYARSSVLSHLRVALIPHVA